jgi:hypothetical protein
MATPRKSRREPELRSPIAFHPCSNGEYCPKPAGRRERLAEELFRRLVEEKHRRAGLSRREFSQSSCGLAAALLVINQVYGCGGNDGAPQPSTAASGGSSGSGGGLGLSEAGSGGAYEVDEEMMEDPEQACAKLTGDEFIFDVQVHPPSPLAPWTDRELPMDAETFVKTVFVDSDTRVACLTGIPAARSLGPSNIDANRQLEELIERFAGPRLLYHVNIDPTLGPGELDYMGQLAAQYEVAAWKVYPHVGPWRLDDELGSAMIEQARALGVTRFAAHRGIGTGLDYEAPSSPVDLVLAAKANPDISFLTYHSGWDSRTREDHAFDPNQKNPTGIDRLIKALVDNEIGNEGNVYAELGSTWRGLMTDPLGAAHALGKLLKHLGEDRIVWGTDSVFTGSAQEQIVAFRAFQIPLELQEAHGYPPLSDCAKRKILGLNAASVYGVEPTQTVQDISDDTIAQWKMAYLNDRDAVDVPSERNYGPRTRREFLRFLEWERHARG